MHLFFSKFAAEASAPSGLSALGLNIKAFIFQLITFVIVLLILRRYVFPRLVETLEKRRATLEESLVQAKQTEQALLAAQEASNEILKKARAQADQSISDAARRAVGIVQDAENKAAEKAARIIADAQAQLDQDRVKLRTGLKRELVELVALATEKVTRQKMDSDSDKALVSSSIKELN